MVKIGIVPQDLLFQLHIYVHMLIYVVFFIVSFSQKKFLKS